MRQARIWVSERSLLQRVLIALEHLSVPPRPDDPCTPVANALPSENAPERCLTATCCITSLTRLGPGARSASANAVELIVAADAIAGYVSLTRK